MPTTHFSVFSSRIQNHQPRLSKASSGVRAALIGGATILSGLVIGAVVYEASGGFRPSRGSPTSTSLPLSITHFTPVTVTESTACDSKETHKLITLRVSPQLRTIPPSPVYSVYLKDSDIQVERPYTPLKGIERDGTMRFWVKKYEKGEVGRWFHRRKVGETVEIRGPVKTLEWKDDAWDEVILISGGTGITPFYQLLYNTFGNHSKAEQSRRTHITLMHASSSSASLPPPEILDDIQHWAGDRSNNFTFKTFINDGNDALKKRRRIDVEAIEDTRLERGLVFSQTWLDRIRGVQREPPNKKSVLFVICGPESMITDVAGTRLGRPEMASKVGGILGSMGYTADEVRKL